MNCPSKTIWMGQIRKSFLNISSRENKLEEKTGYFFKSVLNDQNQTRFSLVNYLIGMTTTEKTDSTASVEESKSRKLFPERGGDKFKPSLFATLFRGKVETVLTKSSVSEMFTNVLYKVSSSVLQLQFMNIFKCHFFLQLLSSS